VSHFSIEVDQGKLAVYLDPQVETRGDPVMTFIDIRRIFEDSLRLYFAPLRGAVRCAQAESKQAMDQLRKNAKRARSEPPSAQHGEH
jgi:hypothetical protein